MPQIRKIPAWAGVYAHIRWGMWRVAVAAVLAIAFSPFSASAKIFALSDFDGTLAEYRKVYGGTFNTAIRLFRIRYQGLPLGPRPQGPDFIDIRVDDFERLERIGAMARGEGLLGALNETIETLDGQTVTAGYYQKIYPDSYHRFLGDGDAKTALSEDMAAALAVKKKGGTWQAPFWKLFAFYLNQASEDVACGVHTARGGDLQQAFEPSIQSGLIRRGPDAEWTTALADASADRFGRGGVASMKANWAAERLYRIGRIPLGDGEKEVPNSDGDGHMRGHTVIFADDKPENLQAILAVAQDYVRRRAGLVPVKVIIFNAGSPDELRQWGYPRAVTLMTSGRLRPATEADFLAPLGVKLTLKQKKDLGLPTSCKGVLQ
jgi:hypothetical protein